MVTVVTLLNCCTLVPVVNMVIKGNFSIKQDYMRLVMVTIYMTLPQYASGVLFSV